VRGCHHGQFRAVAQLDAVACLAHDLTAQCLGFLQTAAHVTQRLTSLPTIRCDDCAGD